MRQLTSPRPHRCKPRRSRKRFEGKDVLATAQTGTGKTLAFLIPVMEQTMPAPNVPGITALVLVATRELAMQVLEQYNALRGKQLPALLLWWWVDWPKGNSSAPSATVRA